MGITLMIVLAIIVVLVSISQWAYRDVLYRKGMNLYGGSRIEFIKGKPFVIITQKEYVEYIVKKQS